MDQNSSDEIHSLYKSLCAAIARGDDLSDFSKEDLLDVYEYTRSIPDDYIANEIVGAGLRRYPKSRAFLKRKGLLFHDIGQESFCETILLGLPEKSFVRVVTAMKNGYVRFGSAPDFKRELDGFAKNSIEDGDILYMIDIFDDVDGLHFLEESAELISGISQYPSTFYLELSRRNDEKGNLAAAIEYGRRLTEVDPFDITGWIHLALLYIKDKNYDAALESTEYALAIDPEEVGSRMIKALTIYESRNDDQELPQKLVAEVLSVNPDDPRALYVAAYIDLHEHRQAEGVAKIFRMIPGCNVDQRRDAYDLLLRSLTGPLDDGERIRFVELMSEYPEQNIADWIVDLNCSGAYQGAYELTLAAMGCRIYIPHTFADISALAEAMYRIGMFKEIIQFIEQNNGGESMMMLKPFDALIYAVSQYRLDRMAELRQWIGAYLTFSPWRAHRKEFLLDFRLLNDGAFSRLEALRRRLDGDASVDESAFDPFIVSD